MEPDSHDAGEQERANPAGDEKSGHQEALPGSTVAGSDRSGKARKSSRRAPRRERRTTRGGPPTESEETGGEELERRVGRMEFAEGALVRVRVPIRADAAPGRDVLTDIDVLSLDVDLRLRLTRSVLECKSGTGEAGEPDRLFWLAGFREFLGAEHAVLVREAITTRGIQLAQQLRLQLMDARTLGDREAANAWFPERFAHVGGRECMVSERRTDTQLRGVASIPPALVAFLRNGAPLADSHVILGALASLGEAARDAAVIPDPAGLVIAGHALMALLLATVQDASRLGTVSDESMRRRLTLALTAGDPDDSYILDVLARADEVVRHEVDRVHDAYRESGTPRIEVELASLRSLVSAPPGWIDVYIDLVHRLRANPVVARDLLQTAELAVFEALAGGNAHEADAFSHLFTPEHRSLLVAAIRTLSQVLGEKLVDRLDGIKALSFERSAPAVPNRRQAPDERAAPPEKLASPQNHPR